MAYQQHLNTRVLNGLVRVKIDPHEGGVAVADTRSAMDQGPPVGRALFRLACGRCRGVHDPR